MAVVRIHPSATACFSRNYKFPNSWASSQQMFQRTVFQIVSYEYGEQLDLQEKPQIVR